MPLYTETVSNLGRDCVVVEALAAAKNSGQVTHPLPLLFKIYLAVKFENIMFEVASPDSAIKVLDFGLSVCVHLVYIAPSLLNHI